MARRELQEINAGSMADIAFLLLVFFLMVTTIDSEKGILRQLPPPIPEDIVLPEVRQRNVFEVKVNSNNQLLVEGRLMEIGNLKAAARKFLIADGAFEDLREDPDLPVRVRITKAVLQPQIDQLNGLKQQAAAAGDNDKVKDIEDAIDKLERKKNAIDLFKRNYKELPGSALISMQNDNNTDYDTYIQVQNELQSAVNELRDEVAIKYFGVPYSKLEEDYEAQRTAEGGADEAVKNRIYAVQAVYPQRISEAEPVNLGGY
jgi:biopolymer transport protein ExbD